MGVVKRGPCTCRAKRYVGTLPFIDLYERSTCRYVRLNTLSVLQVHGPCFNAPVKNGIKKGLVF